MNYQEELNNTGFTLNYDNFHLTDKFKYEHLDLRLDFAYAVFFRFEGSWYNLSWVNPQQMVEARTGEERDDEPVRIPLTKERFKLIQAIVMHDKDMLKLLRKDNPLL